METGTVRCGNVSNDLPQWSVNWFGWSGVSSDRMAGANGMQPTAQVDQEALRLTPDFRLLREPDVQSRDGFELGRVGFFVYEKRTNPASHNRIPSLGDHSR